MKKRILLIVAGLLCLIVLGSGEKGIQAQDSTITPSPSLTPVVMPLQNNVVFESDDVQETIDNPKVEITIRKPLLVGPDGSNFDKFNAAVDAIVQGDIELFKKDALTVDTSVTLPPEIAALGSSLEINFEPIKVTQTLLSIKFDVFFYYVGAAHPDSYSNSLNFDLKAGKALTLAQLFLPGSKYLDTISKYAIDTLTKAGTLDFPDGAQPKPENYQNWNITDNGLQITFDEYQVSTHAAGPQIVVVPYATLKSIIDPKGALGQYVK